MFSALMPWTKRRLAREAEAKEKELADAKWKEHKARVEAARKRVFEPKANPKMQGMTAQSACEHEVRPRPGYVNDYANSTSQDSNDMAMFLSTYQNTDSDTPSYTAPSESSSSSSSSDSCSSSDSGSSDSGSSCSDSGSSGGGSD